MLAELERHAQLPGQFGISDCWYMAFDIAAAIVQRDLDYKFQYSTFEEAWRIMHKNKWRTIAEGFATYFDEVPPSMAWRGDIGVVEWEDDLCGVVVLGADVMGKHPIKGGVRVSRMMLRRAFRVE